MPYLGAVADIKNENGIIEIQTRAFNKLKPRLESFIEHEKVSIVFPIIENKTVCRIDVESGETVSIRKSPKRGRASDCLAELAKIRDFLLNPNLTVILVFLDATETRMSNGRIKVGRKKTDKIDCIPTAINSILTLSSSKDYYSVLPRALPDKFTSAQFEKITGFRAIDKHSSLMLLLQLGVLTREKKDGREYVYSISDKL